MEKIKVFKNFMSTDYCNFFINYLEELIKTKPEEMSYFPTVGRTILTFGHDSYDGYKTHLNLDIVKDNEAIIRHYVDKVIEKIKQEFNDDSDIYLCNLWLSKQDPGGQVERHNDANAGDYSHLNYSAIIYLNTLEVGGELEFIEMNKTIKPEAGDLVVFLTHETGDHQVVNIPEDRWAFPMWFTNDERLKL